jgi:hypothetical protein
MLLRVKNDRTTINTSVEFTLQNPAQKSRAVLSPNRKSGPKAALAWSTILRRRSDLEERPDKLTRAPGEVAQWSSLGLCGRRLDSMPSPIADALDYARFEYITETFDVLCLALSARDGARRNNASFLEIPAKPANWLSSRRSSRPGRIARRTGSC